MSDTYEKPSGCTNHGCIIESIPVGTNGVCDCARDRIKMEKYASWSRQEIVRLQGELDAVKSKNLRVIQENVQIVENAASVSAKNAALQAQLDEAKKDAEGSSSLAAHNAWRYFTCKVQLNKANELIKGLDEYLDTGSNQTAVYQNSKGHAEIKDYLSTIPSDDTDKPGAEG